MSRPPLRVRLAQGRMLPVPPGEGVDGAIVVTPETEILVRDSTWARRRLARGDLELAPERHVTTTSVVDIDDSDLQALAKELDELEAELTLEPPEDDR